MDIVKFSLRLLITHLIMAFILFALMPISVGLTNNVVIQWLIAIVLMGIYWAIVWADSAGKGERDAAWTETMERRRQQNNEYIPDKTEQGRDYSPFKGFIAGSIASIPGFILSIIAVMVYGNENVFSIVQVILRIWFIPYIHFFTQFPGLIPYIYLFVVLILPAVAGIGYMNGPVRRRKIREIIEKNNQKKNKKRKK